MEKVIDGDALAKAKELMSQKPEEHLAQVVINGAIRSKTFTDKEIEKLSRLINLSIIEFKSERESAMELINNYTYLTEKK